MLVKAGADVNVHDKDSLTPLLKACNMSNIDFIVTCLIDAGAVVNDFGKDGQSPLMKACLK